MGYIWHVASALMLLISWHDTYPQSTLVSEQLYME